MAIFLNKSNDIERDINICKFKAYFFIFDADSYDQIPKL